jgi:hypothetical protein
MRRIICPLLFVLCGAVCAQDGKVYKIVHPDGRVSYTDKPPADKGLGVRELPAAPGTSGVQLMDPGKVQEVNARIKASLEERDKRALEEQRAREKLREAERAKEEGAEPGGGERTGTAPRKVIGKDGKPVTKADGTPVTIQRGRLNEDYDERQKQLDEDLKKARNGAD